MADREDISYLSDIGGIVKAPSGGTQGNIPVFGATADSRTTVVDSGKKPADFVTSAEVSTEVQDAVSSATYEIWDAVKGAEALRAYGSAEWASGVAYEDGDMCRVYIDEDDGYVGYKCIEGHTSGSGNKPPNVDYWEVALTARGYNAIEGILSEYSTNGLAALADLAPQYDGNTYYYVNQLAVKDDVLQICTVQGRGPAATFTHAGATVEAAIAALKQSLQSHEDDTTVHVTSSEKTTWNGKQDAIENLSTIISNAAAGAEAAARDKVVIANGTVTAKHADDTGSVELALKSDLSGDSAAYKIEESVALGPSEQDYDPAKVTYRLKDRTVNYVDVEIYDNREIVLFPPVAQKTSENVPLARDFYVVFILHSNQDATAEMVGMDLSDYAGEDVSIDVPVGEFVTYRFTDKDEGQSEFLVTCFADPSYRKLRELEKALDDIIEDQGGAEFKTGIYLRDESTGLYHKITAVRDPETGEVNIGVDQTGTYGPDAPVDDGSGLGSSSGEG